ncbi:MAG: hypothetical protein ACXWV9_02105 [Flavisolibacter sp.]
MKYILLFLFSGLIISCDKEENDPPPTKAELLTKSSWKYESGGVDQDKNGTIDLSFAATGLLQPCILDNTATFTLGGTGVTDEGATKCDPAAPQTTSFSWSFNGSATEIFISGGLLGLGGQFKITTLTDTRFSLAKDTAISFSGGIPQNISLIVNLQH